MVFVSPIGLCRQNACPLRNRAGGNSSAFSVVPFERGQLDREVADGRAFS